MVQIDPSWQKQLENEFTKPYFAQIKSLLTEQKKQWVEIFPKSKDIFAAFDATPFDQVRVVILGQDPYHGQWQAHWLSFSVPDWIPKPPSLQNIFKEIQQDLGWEITGWNIPDSWNLLWRAKQWVFLLNAILTVQAHKPASHAKIWREIFTDAVITTLSQNKSWLVFLLWWKFAQSKSSLIDQTKHHFLTAPHPSPFSAHTWFFGSQHFSQTNDILLSQKLEPIRWF